MKKIPVKKSEEDKFCTKWFDLDKAECFDSHDGAVFRTKNNNWVLRTKNFNFIEVSQDLVICWMIDHGFEDKLPKELLRKYEI